MFPLEVSLHFNIGDVGAKNAPFVFRPHDALSISMLIFIFRLSFHESSGEAECGDTGHRIVHIACLYFADESLPS